MYTGLTKAGEIYLANRLANKLPVNFLKVKIGNGTVPHGADASETTELYSFKKEIQILDITQTDNVARIRVLIDNSDVEQGFFMKELGVYVDDDGKEKLYWYVYEDNGQYVHSKTERAIQFDLELVMEVTSSNSTILDWNKDKIWISKTYFDEKVRTYEIPTIAELQSRKNLKVGDIVEVLGYYSTGDGAGHKRIIASEDDGSGVQLSNNLWANLIKPVTFYYSNFEELKQSSIFVGAKAVVYGLVFDIKKTSNVGFEDELHIKTVRNVYANFSLDESKFDYIVRKQNEYIAKYLDLNARNKEVNIVLQGDSITYGHDTQSSDKIDPPTTVLPDGSKHTVTRSPNTIDKKLQEYLREVTRRGNINVINRGYSGDWAEKSYTRWRTTANSNLTLFLLGQNDQGGNWVPEKSRTIEEFFKWNLMLGIREILRGGAVVFTNGYRAKSLESGKVRQTFLEMTKSVSETIGAVFFDTTDFLLGADDTYYSDGVHLNSKGNARVAARMTAFFLGENIIKPVSVKIGDYLGDQL